MKTSRFAFAAAVSLLSAAAFAGPNDGPTGAYVPVGSLATNQGAVLCTAAINSDGTVAGGNTVNKASTSRTGLGTYQVAFLAPCNPTITAARGWARWVQIDTLGAGAAPAGSCTTADRSGVPSAVFVECTDTAGNLADRSFFLFVAR